MREADIIHLLRAAHNITGTKEFLVIGSQAILGSHPDAARDLRKSLEADICTPAEPENAELIDGNIGEMSQFHTSHGYYAHGVVQETATLHPDWKIRAISKSYEEAGDFKVTFLHPLDIAYSKLAAGREKDIGYVRECLRTEIFKSGKLAQLIHTCPELELQAKLAMNFQICSGKALPPPEPEKGGVSTVPFVKQAKGGLGGRQGR